jgi:hypothetical protein
VVGGIVVMRYGENDKRYKRSRKNERSSKGLPEGVTLKRPMIEVI